MRFGRGPARWRVRWAARRRRRARADGDVAAGRHLHDGLVLVGVERLAHRLNRLDMELAQQIVHFALDEHDAFHPPLLG